MSRALLLALGLLAGCDKLAQGSLPSCSDALAQGCVLCPCRPGAAPADPPEAIIDLDAALIVPDDAGQGADDAAAGVCADGGDASDAGCP